MWALVLLGGALAVAARADELLEPIAQDDLYSDAPAEPDFQAPPPRVRARTVGFQNQQPSFQNQQVSSNVVSDVDQCAWAEESNSGNTMQWMSIPVPIPAGLCACSRWVAGTEVTFLAPSFRGASVSNTVTDGVGTTVNAGSNNSFNNFTYAPRIWIGKQGECWGFMTRFWYLSDYSAVLNPIVANGTNVGGQSINALKAYTFDLEAQRMFARCDGSRCFLTFGPRYASLSSDSVLNSMATLAGPGFASAYAGTSSRFNGVGLTSALYGYKPICCSDFSLFYNIRNSVIFGNNESQAQTSAVAQNITPSNAVAGGGAIANGASTLYIGEIQLGAQWNHQFKCVPMNAFFRIAGEYQFWGSNNSVASSASSATVLPTTNATAAAYAGKTDLSFVGFAIATGCTW